MNIKTIPETRPVEPPLVKPMNMAQTAALPSPRIIHMFTRPEELESEKKMDSEAMSPTSPHVFPRIVRMFTHPDEVAGGKDEPDKK